jgi:hypothetical protein
MVGGELLQANVMSASHLIQATCGTESTCMNSSLCKTTSLPISHRLFCQPFEYSATCARCWNFVTVTLRH